MDDYDEHLKQMVEKCNEECLNEMFSDKKDGQQLPVLLQKIAKKDKKQPAPPKYVYVNQNTDLRQISRQIITYESQNLSYKIQLNDLRTQSYFNNLLKLFDDMQSQ